MGELMTFADTIWDFFILLPPAALVLCGAFIEFFKSCPIVSVSCLGALCLFNGGLNTFYRVGRIDDIAVVKAF